MMLESGRSSSSANNKLFCCWAGLALALFLVGSVCVVVQAGKCELEENQICPNIFIIKYNPKYNKIIIKNII
jgi:hypothetical protein